MFSGTGPVASWKAYQVLGSDGLYHQGIYIYNSQGMYPVIGYSYSDATCTTLGDHANDFWQPIGNDLMWFAFRPSLVYVIWIWYDNATNQNVLQKTPCIDYMYAPKWN
ncbi:MAG: hypothetical protein ACXVZM_03200 [Terriglobales bacterium]